MHKNNKHSGNYDFETLIKASPKLEPFVFANSYGNVTIDFSNPKAVKALNTALLKHFYDITFWEFPDEHLCPPIPSRVEYIHLLNDLIAASDISEEVTILDIGTGATCIYPLLGHAEYGWSFVATDVHKASLKTAQKIIDANQLNAFIELRFQSDPQQILSNVLAASETVTATMCNPPFYKNREEATEQTLRKLKGLGKPSDELVRNFGGMAQELWYPGGEKAFLHNYLYQSSLLKKQCMWYTSLVSKRELLKSMEASLKKLGASQFRIFEMSLGNKISRVAAWSFV